MGCASSISPFPENKMNKYAIESPRKEDAEEMPETAQNMDNNSDSMPVPMSPVIVRKVQTNEVKDEDVVRGFEEDPAEDDSKIEQNVKAKTKADKFLAGSDGTRAGSSPATIKVETAEGKQTMRHIVVFLLLCCTIIYDD